MSQDDIDASHPFYIAAMLFICAVAVVLNVMVIIVIGRVGKFRTSVEVFLTNLAVSDILQAGIVLPIYFKNASVYDKDFYGDSVVCKLVMFIPLFTVSSAICTIVAIAGDRYRVMVRRRTLNRWETLVIVCLIWLLSFCISAPQLYEYNVYYRKNENTNTIQKACGSEGIVKHFETIYAIIVFVLAYCIPLIILAMCYIRISALVWKHGKRFRSTVSQPPNNNSLNNISNNQLQVMISARKIKVFRMLISITIAFIVLWTPYFILFAIQEIMDMDHSSDFGKWPHIISRIMIVLATVTNPTLYLMFSDPFRKAMLSICKCTSPRPDPIGCPSEQATIESPTSFFKTCLCFSRRLHRVSPNDFRNKTAESEI